MAAVSEKRTKKRPAASDAAPKSKKVHLDKKEKSSNDKGKKRSVPVTLPIIEDAGLSSDEGFEDEQGDEVMAEADDEGTFQPPKDPNGT
ncbi:hypothetical protein PHLCEN_2v6419 [Hermanssonia centrifuga]|uniref:Uncharacterized protein n=1 Tax=Hermanssonia centrifuga TaxID=98765 RepID=A0A2R6NZJ5_9APHY|nr:hypothetical protein PHLCEN_2v6419 [Hermanssonia centrifuga]